MGNVQSTPKQQKASLIIFLATWFMYTMICFTKTNYTALIASIVKEGIFTKSDSGIISAAFYLTFGVSQIVGGKFTDKKPILAITIGMIGTIIPNVLLCFTRDFVSVALLWSICGLAQFGSYPGVVKIISKYLVPEHKAKARTYATLCIGFGGILSYAIVAPVYEWLGWAGVFGMDAVVILVALVFWLYALTKIKHLDVDSYQEQTEQVKIAKPLNEVKKESFIKLLFKSGLIVVIFLNLFGTMLSNGFKTWLSTMMMENYELSPVWASMQTAVVYVVNILGTFVVVWAFRKMKNEIAIKGTAMAICLPFYLMLLLIGKVPAFVILASSMINTTILYSLGNFNIRIASYFEKFGYSATISSALNGMASFGVVLANGGFGIIADTLGWDAVIYVLIGACALCTILYLLTSIVWKKFKEKT